MRTGLLGVSIGERVAIPPPPSPVILFGSSVIGISNSARSSALSSRPVENDGAGTDLNVASGKRACWVGAVGAAAYMQREPGGLSWRHLAVEKPFTKQFSVRHLETVDAGPGD